MPTYFLDYDLRKQKDYKRLYEEIASFNAVRVLKSQWTFKRVNTSALALCNHFKQFIDSDDGLSVVESADWATIGAERTPNDLK